ncbi:HAD hydrolase, family IB [Mycobacteroides abscessus subsp. massiliense]|nr:HAD hydrolase, family IB [Mycobacteroides abscessus subsp. massiliense]
MTANSTPHPVADIALSPVGSEVGAFFDLDGTLVAGFTPTAHARDRMRRRQASVGEVLGVLEATFRYKLGRMEFERLVVRAAGYLRGDSLAELEAVGERIFHQHNAAMIYPQMRERVSAHQNQGHTVVLSSSALTIRCCHPRASPPLRTPCSRAPRGIASPRHWRRPPRRPRRPLAAKSFTRPRPARIITRGRRGPGRRGPPSPGPGVRRRCTPTRTV